MPLTRPIALMAAPLLTLLIPLTGYAFRGTPLHGAVDDNQIDRVETLLAQGADPNAQDRDDHTTPLHWAMIRDNRAVVKALVAKGANLNAKDRQGRTPLHWAAEKGRTAMAKALLTLGADPNVKDDLYGATPLDMAAVEGDRATVEALLDKGADPNVKKEGGATPLHGAAAKGHTATVEALLAKGADPNVQNRDDWTPLHWAAYNGHLNTVEALLVKGADPNLKDGTGSTPSDLAAAKGHTGAMAALLKKAENRHIETAERRARPGPPGEPVSKDELQRLLKEAVREAAKTQPEEKLSAPPELVVDVERLPAMTRQVKQDAYAVVIGIEQYTDLAPPDFAVRDATWMKEYLVHVMGYPEQNIQLLTNAQATRSRVQSAIETWLPNQDPKAVFVYYSGHGAPDPATGESYLVPTDGSPSDLQTTGYPLKRLAQALGKLPAKEIVVVMDSCFSGQPGTRSVIAKGTKPMVITTEGPWAVLGERGIVFTAGNQVSTVYEEKKHGLFTYFFLKGLQGAADLDGNGAVQVQELFTYLTPEVVKAARRQNVSQEPGLWPPPEQMGPRAVRALATLAHGAR